MKIPIRAAQNKQKGRMRPASRQFDMPGLKGACLNCVLKSRTNEIIKVVILYQNLC